MRPNLSSSSRCSSVRRCGICTFTSTRWSPRPNPCKTGIPQPFSTLTSPGCVPGSSSSSSSPSSVGTATFFPSAASVIDLTMTEAALGKKVAVPTLEGELELELEPGTQPGEVKVLKGCGMPVLQGFGRGDQRVLVNVQIPHRLTDEQRELLERFGRMVDADTYRPDEGF